MVENLPAMPGDTGSNLGSGRFSGEGNGHPLQYSCLENSMCREVWIVKSMIFPIVKYECESWTIKKAES